MNKSSLFQESSSFFLYNKILLLRLATIFQNLNNNIQNNSFATTKNAQKSWRLKKEMYFDSDYQCC